MKKNMMIKDPILNMLNKSLLMLPTPTSISYLWNMGFLLGVTLMLQIITGLMLSMNYIPSTEMAFESIIHIMRDTSAGWTMRYLHMNGASLFFVLLYVHILRGMYFSSPSKMPMVWGSGVVILLMTMGAAFLGYVLPWGQMSFWGATVITSMVSALPYVGESLNQWLWGNYSVSQPTLNRFFSLHFLLPLIISALVMVHLIFLHQTGSSNPTGVNPNLDKMKFFPYFATKDFTPVGFIIILAMILLSLAPDAFGDVENFNPASMAVTPAHIQPEWYFLFAYAILRSIPSKLGGVIAMALAMLVLMVLIMSKNKMNMKFSPHKKLIWAWFIVTAIMLTWIGANPVEAPFTEMGQALTVSYFCSIFLL